MHTWTKGFTIIELLVVVAIISITAAILFPVFTTARGAAKRSVCISNHKQAIFALSQYLNDYEDKFPPPNYYQDGGTSKTDRTWIQMLLPYGNSFSIFKDPEDLRGRPNPDSSFDQDLVPGDTLSQYYTASKRANMGFNYLYLSPVYKTGTGSWVSSPKVLSQITNQATLLFVDTVGELDSHGVPTGGGSYLAIPPCRYTIGDTGIKTDLITQRPYNPGVTVFAAHSGWSNDRNSEFHFGYAWPWHLGHMTTSYVDGHVRAISPDRIGDGCDIQEGWAGLINDITRYSWIPE